MNLKSWRMRYEDVYANDKQKDKKKNQRNGKNNDDESKIWNFLIFKITIYRCIVNQSRIYSILSGRANGDSSIALEEN